MSTFIPFWKRMLQRDKELQAAKHETDPSLSPWLEEAAPVPEPIFCGVGTLDPRSPTWAFIRSWAEESLRKAREKNDNINCDPTRTSVLRGEIKMLKELISLPNPKKGLLITDEDDY